MLHALRSLAGEKAVGCHDRLQRDVRCQREIRRRTDRCLEKKGIFY